MFYVCNDVIFNFLFSDIILQIGYCISGFSMSIFDEIIFLNNHYYLHLVFSFFLVNSKKAMS